MAYDRELADRLRELLASEVAVTEKAMFGGLAFLVGGHMAVSASARGGLLLRIDPQLTDDLLADPRAAPFVMRGREMAGWLHIDIDSAAPEAELRRWVRYGVAQARSLSPR